MFVYYKQHRLIVHPVVLSEQIASHCYAKAWIGSRLDVGKAANRTDPAFYKPTNQHTDTIYPMIRNRYVAIASSVCVWICETKQSSKHTYIMNTHTNSYTNTTFNWTLWSLLLIVINNHCVNIWNENDETSENESALCVVSSSTPRFSQVLHLSNPIHGMHSRHQRSEATVH